MVMTMSLSFISCLFLAAGYASDVCPQHGSSSNARTEGDMVVFDAGEVAYRLEPAKGLSSIQGRFKDGRWIALAEGFVVNVTGVGPVETLTHAKINREDSSWHGRYRFPNSSDEMMVRIDLSGGTLRVRLSAEKGCPLAIPMPEPAGSRGLDIPYLRGYDGTIRYLDDDKLFFSYLVDWTQTNSAVPVPNISYRPNLAGQTPPLGELIAITLSDEIHGVLPSIPNSVSPYRAEIADRMVVEFWYGNFDRIGETLDLYHGYGMDRTAAIIHRWQRYGYDCKLPDIFPPDPKRGGLETLRAAVRRAVGYGMRVALHENYCDVYPDAPSYDEADLMRLENGEFQPAWTNSKHCSPSKMKLHAGKVMPTIRREIGSNACFLDVHSAQAPWFRPDFRPDAPHSAQMKGTRLFTNELWNYARETYGGPVFGEGAYDWVHAGCLDAANASLSVRERFFVDFILLRMRPLAINHGVGYYERWNRFGYEPKDWMLQTPWPEEMDEYRAMEIAFGAAANVGHQANHVVELVAKEYYLVRPLVSRQADSQVTEIAYHDGQAWLTPSQAILCEQDAVRRVRIAYDNGLVVHVNRSGEAWRIDSETAVGPLGFFAQGPGVLAYTNNHKGYWCDYYGDGELFYLDSRNSDWHADPLGQRWSPDNPRANDGELLVAEGPVETDTAVACIRTGEAWRLFMIPQGRAGHIRLRLTNPTPNPHFAPVQRMRWF